MNELDSFVSRFPSCDADMGYDAKPDAPSRRVALCGTRCDRVITAEVM